MTTETTPEQQAGAVEPLSAEEIAEWLAESAIKTNRWLLPGLRLLATIRADRERIGVLINACGSPEHDANDLNCPWDDEPGECPACAGSKARDAAIDAALAAEPQP